MSMISKEFTEALSVILEDTDRAGIDAAQEVYRLIVCQEDQSDVLQYFLENAVEIQTFREENQSLYFTDETLYSLKNRCNKLIDGILTKLLQQGLECGKFYRKLWNSIQDGALLDLEEEKIYALYYLWIDIRLPYFSLDKGIYMENDKFREISDKRCKEIKKACYILEAPLQQRTEQTSLIIQILEGCESEEEKAVILAQIFSYLERRIWDGIYRTIQESGEEQKQTD